jgi:hypothetical protein
MIYYVLPFVIRYSFPIDLNIFHSLYNSIKIHDLTNITHNVKGENNKAVN